MQSTSFSHIHGYTNSSLDNSIRAFLTNGQVAAFSFTPQGVKGHLRGQELILPQQLRHIANASSLTAFLKTCRLSVDNRLLLLHPRR